MRRLQRITLGHSLAGSNYEQTVHAPQVRELMERACGEWSRAINAAADLIYPGHSVRLEVVSPDGPHDWTVIFGVLEAGGGVIAQCQPRAGGGKKLVFDRFIPWELTWCQRVFGRRNGQSFLALLLHEMGHAMGLRHGDGDVMQPRPCVVRVGQFSGAAAARQLFGGGA